MLHYPFSEIIHLDMTYGYLVFIYDIVLIHTVWLISSKITRF